MSTVLKEIARRACELAKRRDHGFHQVWVMATAVSPVRLDRLEIAGKVLAPSSAASPTSHEVMVLTPGKGPRAGTWPLSAGATFTATADALANRLLAMTAVGPRARTVIVLGGELKAEGEEVSGVVTWDVGTWERPS